MNLQAPALAPELDVSDWVGPPQSLAELRGRVVLIEVFQMLCPACVTMGIPQARRIRRSHPEVSVIGLHSVFEHHSVMERPALEVFLSEFGVDFPVGIDRPGLGTLPRTMRRYALRGTPTTLLIDRAGRLRLSHLGVLDDLALGVALGRLLAEPVPEPVPEPERTEIGIEPGAGITPSVCEPGTPCA